MVGSTHSRFVRPLSIGLMKFWEVSVWTTQPKNFISVLPFMAFYSFKVTWVNFVTDIYLPGNFLQDCQDQIQFLWQTFICLETFSTIAEIKFSVEKQWKFSMNSRWRVVRNRKGQDNLLLRLQFLLAMYGDDGRIHLSVRRFVCGSISRDIERESQRYTHARKKTVSHPKNISSENYDSRNWPN